MFIFLVSVVTFSVLCGLGTRRIHERRTPTVNLIFRIMALSRLSASEARATVKGVAYLLACVLGIVGFSMAYRPGLASMFRVSADLVVPTLLGMLAELSLSALLTRIIVTTCFPVGIDVGAEVKNIPWIQTLLESPRSIVPIAVVTTAVLEDVLFRGVVLWVLGHSLGMSPPLAIGIGASIFVGQQVIQLRTGYQAAIIGSSSLVIAVIGGMLFTLTGSVVPAAIAHASFVVFYVRGMER